MLRIDGMDDMQMCEFALFLYEENQKKSKQLDEMIARLDEIGKDLKEARKQINSLSAQNKKAEKTYWSITLCVGNTKSLRKSTMIFLTAWL